MAANNQSDRVMRAAESPPLATREADRAGSSASGRRFARPPAGTRGESRRQLEYSELLAVPREPPSRRDTIRRRALALGDVLSLCGAFAVTSFAIRGGHAVYAPVVLAAWVLLNKILGLYDRDAAMIDKSTLHEFPSIVRSIALGAGLLYMLGPLAGLEVHRGEALAFLVLGSALTACMRAAARRVVGARCGPERALIVGSDEVSRLMTRKIDSHPEYGIEVVGCVGDERQSGEGPSLVGDLSRFAEICRELRVDRVVVGFSTLHYEDLLDTVRASKLLGVKLSVVPRLFEVMGRSTVMDEIEGMSLLGLTGLSRTRSSLMLKRAFDTAAAGAVMLLLAPLMLLIALAIRLTSRGPVLSVTERTGRGNRRFKVYRFRVTREPPERRVERSHAESSRFSRVEAGAALTRVGRALKRLGLDGLPQLWNVLRGDMSLVGPRPLAPSDDHQAEGWRRAVLELTPGVTGPWQVMSAQQVPRQEMAKLDYLYIADWSLWNDLKLLVRSAPLVLSPRR